MRAARTALLSSAVVLAAFAQGDGDYGTGDDPLLGGGSVHKTENFMYLYLS
jgi:hypothetical protein